MVIELVLAGLALATAGSAVLAIRRRRQVEEGPPALLAPRQLAAGELLPEDVITHLGADYLVEGVATFEEGGRRVLVVASLTDGSEGRFLIVDLLEAPRCALAEARPPGACGQRVPSWVPDGPLELELSRRASLRVTTQGSCPLLPKGGACELGLYHGPGQRKGAMLLGGGAELLLIGRGVTEEGLTLLPGGGGEDRAPPL